MARNKLYSRKKRYGAEQNKTKKPPTWITLKTNRKFRQTPTQYRQWRRNRIKR